MFLNGYRYIEAKLAPVMKAVGASNLLRLGGIVVAGLTFVMILVDIVDRADEREDRRGARIERAWARIQLKMGGDIGKGNAINTLIRADERVSEADFSCAVAGIWEKTNISGKTTVLTDWDSEQCKDRPVFSGVDFRSLRGELPKLSNSLVINATFDGTDPGSLRQVRFLSSSFQTSEFTYNTPGSLSFSDSNFTSAHLYEELLPFIEQSNFTDVVIKASFHPELIKWPERDAMNPFPGNWAWADHPARIERVERSSHIKANAPSEDLLVSEVYRNISFCDPRERPGYRRDALLWLLGVQHWDSEATPTGQDNIAANGDMLPAPCLLIKFSDAQKLWRDQYETRRTVLPPDEGP